VELYARILFEKIANGLRLVRREIIQHDMYLFADGRLRDDFGKKRGKVSACVAACRLP
jgi:hypothetical protein